MPMQARAWQSETSHDASPGGARHPTLHAAAARVGLFVLAIYLLSASSDLRHNGDTDLRYQTTRAIVDHHRLWIAHPVAMGTRVAAGRGGHLYVSAYGPGQIVLMVPLYVAGRILAGEFSLPSGTATLYASRSLDLFLGAALTVLFLYMAVSMGYGLSTAILLTVLFALATAAWPDAQSALEQTQVSVCLLLAALATWRFVRGGLRDRRWLLLAGSATGFGLFTRYDFVIYVLLIAAFPALRRLRSGETRQITRDWLAYALAILPWIALLMLWNELRFGSPFNVALHLKTFGELPWVGFLGLTLSPGKGIIWYVPLLFLLPCSLPALYRRSPVLAAFFCALVLVTVVFYSNVLYWHGDPAWGPRYLYPALPYLVLPLGELFARWRHQAFALKAAATLLIILSLGIQVAAVSVNQWRFWYRLEAAQEHTGHQFWWGPTRYEYYWIIPHSPLVIGMQNLYEVARLDATGAQQYRLSKRPTACIGPQRCFSNPARDYPINTLAFWWTDTRHPLFDARVQGAIAVALLLIALESGGALLRVTGQERRNLG